MRGLLINKENKVFSGGTQPHPSIKIYDCVEGLESSIDCQNPITSLFFFNNEGSEDILSLDTCGKLWQYGFDGSLKYVKDF